MLTTHHRILTNIAVCVKRARCVKRSLTYSRQINSKYYRIQWRTQYFVLFEGKITLVDHLCNTTLKLYTKTIQKTPKLYLFAFLFCFTYFSLSISLIFKWLTIRHMYRTHCLYQFEFFFVPSACIQYSVQDILLVSLSFGSDIYSVKFIRVKIL